MPDRRFVPARNTLLDGWSRRVLSSRWTAMAPSRPAAGGATGWLDAPVADPYFRKTPPKSTGPELFLEFG